MNRIYYVVAIIALFFSLPVYSQSEGDWKSLSRDINFFVISDSGRNGYYDQCPIAEMMGQIGESLRLKCVVSTGDIHHFDGVRSTQDPLWMTNYELVYKHPELMLPWYVGLGNHEYRGTPQACVDYSQVSARWHLPSRYYTQVIAGKKATVRIVMLDTTPLIDYCREDTSTYPDANNQNREEQLEWLDRTLIEADEDWVIVMGHHPIYAHTPKNQAENEGMQACVEPILKRHANVIMYVSGHLHSFQHIHKADSPIDYVVNGSASQSRPEVLPIDGTVFCKATTGVSIVCADKKELTYYMLDKEGNILHSIHYAK